MSYRSEVVQPTSDLTGFKNLSGLASIKFLHWLGNWLLLISLTLLGAPAQATDNVVCVATASALRNALFLAAGNGVADVIQLVQGTYYGNFVYPGPAEAFNLTLKGGYTASCAARALNPTNTIIDGNATSTVLGIPVVGVVANVTIEGLTIRNGKRTNGHGAGLYISLGDAPSRALLQHNRFEGNRAEAGYVGGGVFIAGAATLTDNVFTGNSAVNGGGGAYISGAATLTNNTFTSNSSTSGVGGGVYVGGAVTLTHNTFSTNTAASSSSDSYGGGGYFADAAILNNNTFDGNSANSANYYRSYGGGAYFNATATLTGNTFSSNSSSSSSSYYNAYGGGAYFTAAATLNNNTFSGNSSSARSSTAYGYFSNYNAYGGGAYFTATATLTGNTFSGNSSSSSYSSSTAYGGGAYFTAIATLTGNTFSTNTTKTQGGAAYFETTATLANNTITANTAAGSGGGASFFATSSLTGNVFSGNTATGGNGGGAYCSVSTPTLLNNSLNKNKAVRGGGLYLILPGDETLNNATIANTLFWANTATAGEGADLYLNNDQDNDYFITAFKLFANNSLDQSWPDGFYNVLPFSIPGSNLDLVDPLFINGATNNLHLTAASPMIDAGDKTVTDLPATDRDGTARVVGANVDIGAYEYHYGICGDADGNDVVNIVDALAVARKIVNLPPPPAVDVALADVDENGNVDINDALFIARYSIGLVIPPEVCEIGTAL